MNGDRILSRTLVAAPLLWLASMYFCWVAAWQTLGHRPRPMLDDPKGIQAAWKWFYDLSWGFYFPGLVMFAVLSVGLIAYLGFHREGPWKSRLMEVCTAVGLMVLVVFSGEWFDFVYWYFD